MTQPERPEHPEHPDEPQDERPVNWKGEPVDPDEARRHPSILREPVQPTPYPRTDRRQELIDDVPPGVRTRINLRRHSRVIE